MRPCWRACRHFSVKATKILGALATRVAVTVLSFGLMTSPASAQQLRGTAGAPAAEGAPRMDADALARAAQNPVAAMISVPFQNNTNLNYGPRNDTQNILNIQPVIPLGLNDDWNVITRTIVPVISQPGFAPGEGTTFGLGAVQFSSFLSPARTGRIIWGGRHGRSGADDQRQGPRQQCLGRRSHLRSVGDVGTLGIRGFGQQHLVHGRRRPQQVQQLHLPTLHQLQLPAVARHLPVLLAPDHRELGSAQR